MSYDLFKESIRKDVAVSEQQLDAICNYFEPTKVSKNNMLLVQGQVCKFEGFVKNGCFRVFTIDKKGNENTLYFAAKGWWLMDLDSFMNHAPSVLNIEALEDSEVLLIGKTQKEHLYEEVPVVERLFRIMSQKAIIAWQRRLVRNHCLTAKERYLHFVETYPSIVAKLNDRQISSYLGITHEFLSKIKRKPLSEK